MIDINVPTWVINFTIPQSKQLAYKPSVIAHTNFIVYKHKKLSSHIYSMKLQYFVSLKWGILSFNNSGKPI